VFSASAANRSLVPIDDLVLSHRALIGGGSVSSFGGGDTADERKFAAWFYQDEEIVTCYNSIETFGVSNETIEASIRNSIKRWQNYFDEKQINSDLSKPISTNFNFRGKCRGGERLVFFFGTGPIFSGLLDLRARQNLYNPVAFTNKTHLQKDLMGAKGYIRFVAPQTYTLDSGVSYPDWSKGNNLEFFILHEIGHILGFKHISGTIMAEDAAMVHLSDDAEKPLAIDQGNELFRCLECEEIYIAFETDEAFLTLDAKIRRLGENWFYQVSSSDPMMSFEVVNRIQRDKIFPLVTLFEENRDYFEEPYFYFLKAQNQQTNELMNIELKDHGELVLWRNGHISARLIKVGASPRVEFSQKTFSVNPSETISLREHKKVHCTDRQNFKIEISENDQVLITSEGHFYDSIEYLDSAIFLKNKVGSQHALFQLVEGDKAFFVEGEMKTFIEKLCNDTGASKSCGETGVEKRLTWTPEFLGYTQPAYSVKRYGVYPNDGTFFIATDGINKGTALIDFGSKFQVIDGSFRELKCTYKNLQ
jgi:hypothetical protein